MITQCARCKKIKIGERWVKAQISPKFRDEVSHGFCPDCYEYEMQRIAEYQEEKEKS